MICMYSDVMLYSPSRDLLCHMNLISRDTARLIFYRPTFVFYLLVLLSTDDKFCKGSDVLTGMFIVEALAIPWILLFTFCVTEFAAWAVVLAAV